MADQTTPNGIVVPGQTTPPISFDYDKPNFADKLAAIAGLIGVGSGTAADIIGATRGQPAAGQYAAQSGSKLLEKYGEKADVYNQSKKVQTYLSDPNFQKNYPDEASNAASYLRVGKPKEALDVVQGAIKEKESLKKSLQIQKSGYDYSIAKERQVRADEDADLQKKADRFDDLTIERDDLSKDGKDLPGNKRVEYQTLSGQLRRKGLSVDPLNNPKLANRIDDLSKIALGADQTEKIANEVQALFLKAKAGRFSGAGQTLKQFVQSTPELNAAELLNRVETSKLTMGVMGESSRHANQIEQQLSKLTTNRFKNADEIKAITDQIIGLARDAKNDSFSRVSKMPGMDSYQMDEYKRRLGQRTGSTQPPPNVQPQSAPVSPSSFDELLKKHGGSYNEGKK